MRRFFRAVHRVWWMHSSVPQRCCARLQFWHSRAAERRHTQSSWRTLLWSRASFAAARTPPIEGRWYRSDDRTGIHASTGPIGAIIACAVVAWLRVLANPYRFAHRRWLLRAAGAGTDDPASLLTARIRSGRSIDPSAPVPSPLESALTGGRPADRAAAFYRLSTRYDPELASVLNAALTSATLPVRTPAYAILASLIESALARVAVIARLPIASAPEADRVLAEADAVLRRCPFDIVDSPIREMVAGRVHALCMSIRRQHPKHRGALVVASRALVNSEEISRKPTACCGISRPIMAHPKARFVRNGRDDWSASATSAMARSRNWSRDITRWDVITRRTTPCDINPDHRGSPPMMRSMCALWSKAAIRIGEGESRTGWTPSCATKRH